MKRELISREPDLPQLILKAHAEAVKRFYSDRHFAVAAFLRYNSTSTESDVERLYDVYFRQRVFERVPYVLSEAISAIISQKVDSRDGRQPSQTDFRRAVDNSVVDWVYADGFLSLSSDRRSAMRLCGRDVWRSRTSRL